MEVLTLFQRVEVNLCRSPASAPIHNWSKAFKPGVPFSNATHLNDPDVDRLLEAAAVETVRAKRIGLFREFQVAIATALLEIATLSQFQYTVFNKMLINHTASGGGINGNFADAYLAG